jgi:hypothetical protein
VTEGSRNGASTADRVKVLYIGGYSRSGSTLLLRALAEAPGVVAVGELVNIWSRGYSDDQLCGCGEPFTVCAFWSEVSRAAFGVSSAAVAASHYRSLQRRVHEFPGYLQLWSPWMRNGGFRRSLREYADALTALYRAVAKVSQSSLVVDSSKLPQFARVLAEVPGIELHVVHLVRDSRGSAYSWTRPKVRTEIHWSREEMKRYNVLRSSVEWDAYNLLFGMDRKLPASYMLLRYEDLVRAPGKRLADLAMHIGEPAVAAALSSTSEQVALARSHTVSGNPSRFVSGTTQISGDDTWRNAMPRNQRILVTAMTAPLLRRYGYPIRAGGAPLDEVSGPGPVSKV